MSRAWPLALLVAGLAVLARLAARPQARPAPGNLLPKGEAGRAWQSAVVAGVADAAELLDRLQASGSRQREFHLLGESTFEVRWR